jgi:hypothetical protein
MILLAERSGPVASGREFGDVHRAADVVLGPAAEQAELVPLGLVGGLRGQGLVLLALPLLLVKDLGLLAWLGVARRRPGARLAGGG